eukprot:scaffold49150_cov71-Phaeocystis_antarctica.AAC.4
MPRVVVSDAAKLGQRRRELRARAAHDVRAARARPRSVVEGGTLAAAVARIVIEPAPSRAPAAQHRVEIDEYRHDAVHARDGRAGHAALRPRPIRPEVARRRPPPAEVAAPRVRVNVEPLARLIATHLQRLHVVLGQVGQVSDPLPQLAHLAVLKRAPSARAGASGARVGVVKALRVQDAARCCLAAKRSALG